MSKDYILSTTASQIKTKEEFFNFLQAYNYNNDLSRDTNIENLAKILGDILSYSNIKEIKLKGGDLTPEQMNAMQTIVYLSGDCVHYLTV